MRELHSPNLRNWVSGVRIPPGAPLFLACWRQNRKRSGVGLRVRTRSNLDVLHPSCILFAGPSVAGAVVTLVLVFGSAVLVLSPVVVLAVWARVELGDHTAAQVASGAAIGTMVAAVVFSDRPTRRMTGRIRAPDQQDAWRASLFHKLRHVPQVSCLDATLSFLRGHPSQPQKSVLQPIPFLSGAPNNWRGTGRHPPLRFPEVRLPWHRQPERRPVMETTTATRSSTRIPLKGQALFCVLLLWIALVAALILNEEMAGGNYE